MKTLRAIRPDDFDPLLRIVNAAAEKYRGQIPADCFHEPYMTAEHLRRDIDAGVTFTVCELDGVLVGAMGLQRVRDVDLIRHAYVSPAAQGGGIGAALIDDLKRRSSHRLLVGTWTAATWAIRFYERNGFVLASPARAAELLARYWSIPARQADVSVVLELVPGGTYGS
ncbi:MAG TPA: GNAT family N-acetyltransferase [Steroidobacteraceae bacterium]|nr:GNAT family N-acetyltransferase [Steroidobacteraceae bacterium]